MDKVEVTLALQDEIAKGLAGGRYERVGGVIRETATKRVVAWLREVFEQTGDGLEMSPALGLSSAISTASVLNFAVSSMGFAVVMKRLGAVEQQLQQAREALRLVDYKIDLSFYANFRAALDLATNALTMSNLENREVSAMQAINRFLEAEQHYMHLVDLELEQGSEIAYEYLLTLALAYVAEVRCYLQLEEVETANRRLGKGVAEIRPRYEQLVKVLLTPNPAVYLHPALKEKIDLRRLTAVYRWLDPSLDESSVFEAQRENLFKLAENPQEWADSLPSAFGIAKRGHLAMLKGALPSLPAAFPRGRRNPETEEDTVMIYDRLPRMFEMIEEVIETEGRFEMYGLEMEAVSRLGMSFDEWVHLAPSSDGQSGSGDLMYIVPTQPLELTG